MVNALACFERSDDNADRNGGGGDVCDKSLGSWRKLFKGLASASFRGEEPLIRGLRCLCFQGDGPFWGLKYLPFPGSTFRGLGRACFAGDNSSWVP